MLHHGCPRALVQLQRNDVALCAVSASISGAVHGHRPSARVTITGSSPLLCPSRRLPKGPRRTVLPPPRWGRGAPANPEEVLLLKNSQPMLSDLFLDVDKYIADPGHLIALRVLLDIALPIIALYGLYKLINESAEVMRRVVMARVEAGDAATLRSGGTLFGVLMVALKQPAALMLPWVVLAYTLRTVLNILDLVDERLHWDFITQHLVEMDNTLFKLLSTSSIIFVTWVAIQFKDVLIEQVIAKRAALRGRKELERVLLPLSSLLTWVAVLVGGFNLLSTFNLNLKPLLAVGGAGSLAAGFASQQLLLNAVAGISIFLSRPFVIGEVVTFTGMGGNVEGIVEQVEIMRTLVRTSEGVVVAVPNKVVADSVILNRSRSVTPVNKTGIKAALVQRVLTFIITLPRSLEATLPEVREKVTDHLRELIFQENLNVYALPLASADSANGATRSGYKSPEARKSPVNTVEEGDPAASTATLMAVAEVAAAPIVSLDEAIVEEELPVYINLSRMTPDKLELFVKCELSTVADATTAGTQAIERKMERALISVSQYVSKEYGGTVR